MCGNQQDKYEEFKISHNRITVYRCGLVSKTGGTPFLWPFRKGKQDEHQWGSWGKGTLSAGQDVPTKISAWVFGQVRCAGFQLVETAMKICFLASGEKSSQFVWMTTTSEAAQQVLASSGSGTPCREGHLPIFRFPKR